MFFLRKFRKALLDKHFEESLLFIALGLSAAIVCALYAKLFSYVEVLSLATFEKYPLALFIVAPLFLIISFLLVRWFAPGSYGSGIPQVLACLEQTHRHLADKFLSTSVIFIKILSSLLAVFSGAAIGREGPSLQISAAIANQLGKIGNKFGLKVRIEQLIVAGAASGLAAAFNTPIGGIVYAIEELSKEHIRTFRDILLLSVVISGLTAQLINGNYLYLGLPEIISSYSTLTYFVIAATGLVSGICGALFSKALIHLGRWRAKQTLKHQLFILTCCGLILATVFYFAGERSLYSGKESIDYVLFTKGELPWYEIVSRSFMPIVSSMTGIAGGIFAPSLSAGAVIGGWVSEFIGPEVRTILGLSGMVGFLNGVTHTPITSFILFLEMTDRHLAVFPMMISAVFSTIGSHLISNHSYYEETLEHIKASHSRVE